MPKVRRPVGPGTHRGGAAPKAVPYPVACSGWPGRGPGEEEGASPAEEPERPETRPERRATWPEPFASLALPEGRGEKAEAGWGGA